MNRLEASEHLFQVVQATWNLLEPYGRDGPGRAKASGWGVIIKEALANGRLTDPCVQLNRSSR